VLKRKFAISNKICGIINSISPIHLKKTLTIGKSFLFLQHDRLFNRW
jgi:hypothetical protein